MEKGIDVAKWNGIIDWRMVKNDSVSFAILKVINKQRKVEDAFQRNYQGALAVGLPIDVYNYSYATSVQHAVADANMVVSTIKNKKVNTVWLDVEDKCQQNIGMLLIDIILAYKNVIKKAGFNFGIYTGLSFYNSYIKPYRKHLDCPFWIARYNKGYTVMDFDEIPNASKKPDILSDLWGWQYTSCGRVQGINGNVDLSVKYDKKENESGIVEYSMSRDGNKQISNNFKVKEFRCKDGSDKILVDVDFVKDKLQKIREHFGVPVTINSAYRTVAYNKRVGGASGSYHLKGQAFDIVVKGKTPAEVTKYAQSIGITGIIQYNTFVHVDSRTEKYYARNNNGKITKLNTFS